MVNLESLSLDELKKLRKDVEDAISNFEERRKAEVLKRLDAVAQQEGFSLEQLTGVRVRKSGSISTPKYANPENPAQTWTGRGRKPKWAEQALASGKTLDDLKI